MAPVEVALESGNATKPARFGSATIHIARSAVASPDGAGWGRHFGRVCLSRIALVTAATSELAAGVGRSPLKSSITKRRQSVRKAALICLSMFVLALFANLPFCVTSVVVEEGVGGRNATVCRYFWPEWSVPEFAVKARRLYLTSLGFLLPLSFNFTLYVLIIRKLRRQDAFRSAATRQRDNDTATAVTNMAAFVTASFVVCTGDYHLFKMTNLRLDCKVSQHIHIESPGHTVDLEGVRILDTEQDYFKRGIKEAIYIRALQPSLNRDGGRYRLQTTFDPLLTSHVGKITCPQHLGQIAEEDWVIQSKISGMWTKPLFFGNSALDPVIYALMGTNFQDCLKQLFCRRRYFPSRKRSMPLEKVDAILLNGQCHIRASKND
ncbi:hypothetical protein Bbelb_099370 [Branchiostoma belcheri]|nr:hypothetical protein Bbelb_099370 [Branchiostoma belcheri]